MVYWILENWKKKKVKYILIESVQRRFLERFSVNNINKAIIVDEFNIFKEPKIVEKNNLDDLSFFEILLSIFKKSDKDDIGIINNLNQNALIYNLRFKLKGYGNVFTCL